MATYKKGYKKQNTETVLLKVIVGIIIAVFAFVAMAFVYDTTTQWRQYTNYTAITEFDGIFEYTNGGTEALDDYVVYIYSNTCPNCEAIKTDVLRDGNRLNKETEMFFVANADTMTDTDAELDGFLDTIDEVQLGTPLLIVVADGEFYDAFVGSAEVVDAMNSIEEGTFPAFND